MATVFLQRWDNAMTPAKYDELRELVGWDTNPSEGMKVHVACFEGPILRMLDVWDTEEQFKNFVETRILPGLQKLGIEGMPDLIVLPLHELSGTGF